MSVLQTVCVRIFRFMIGLFSLFCLVFVCLFVCFCGCTTNQSRQKKSVKGQFFYHSPCFFKNSERTHIFNKTKCTTKLVHYDTRTLLLCLRLLMSFWIKDTRTPLFCLRLLKSRLLASAEVVLDKRPYKISSKAMHRVCCFH